MRINNFILLIRLNVNHNPWYISFDRSIYRTAQRSVEIKKSTYDCIMEEHLHFTYTHLLLNYFETFFDRVQYSTGWYT